jgi:hypothetical protein
MTSGALSSRPGLTTSRRTRRWLIGWWRRGSLEAVLDFQECFDEVDTIIYRWDVWAAAYLIGGGCSDDSFTDFRAGVIALGGTGSSGSLSIPTAWPATLR